MNARPPISISTAPWFRPEFCAFMRSPVFLVERYLSRNLLPAITSADNERLDVIGARKSHPILSGGQDAELPEKMPGVPEDPGMDDLAVFDLRDGASVRLGAPIRWRDAHQVAPMGPRRRVPCHHVVSAREQLVDREVQIREGSDVHPHRLPGGIAAVDRCRQRIRLPHVLSVEDLESALDVMSIQASHP